MGCDRNVGCRSILRFLENFAKTNRPSTLTVEGRCNTFPLPIRGRPRIGEGETSVSPDRRDFGPFANHPARGPLSWFEWREPREGKDFGFTLPRGFSRMRPVEKALAKTNEPVAKINHGFSLSYREGLSTFPVTPMGFAPEAPVRRGQDRRESAPIIAGSVTRSRRETGSSGTGRRDERGSFGIVGRRKDQRESSDSRGRSSDLPQADLRVCRTSIFGSRV